MVVGLLYFMLPAAVANTMPLIAKRFRLLERLATPIDAGAHWRGQRLLGEHKTWRGLLLGIIAGTVVTYLQSLLAPTAFDLVDYRTSWLALGLLLSAGALLGDAFKSFLKRRVGIPDGAPWAPFDQIDWAVGALVIASPVISLGWPASFTTVVLMGIGHIGIVQLGHVMRLKKKMW